MKLSGTKRKIADLIGKRLSTTLFNRRGRYEYCKIVEVKTDRAGLINAVYVVREKEHTTDWEPYKRIVTKWMKTRKRIDAEHLSASIWREETEVYEELEGGCYRSYDPPCYKWIWKTECQIRLTRNQRGACWNGRGGAGATIGWFLDNPDLMPVEVLPRRRCER